MIDRVSFVISVFCPMKCPYCPQTVLHTNYKDSAVMEFDDFKQYLVKIPQHTQISFSGTAENWLNKNCSKMICYAYDNGWRNIALTHVAYHMSFEDIEAIQYIQFTRHNVHLPSDEEEMNIVIVSDEYIKKLFLLKSHHPELTFHCFGKIHPKLHAFCQQIKNETPGMQNRANNVFPMNKLPKKKGKIICAYDLYLKPFIYPNGDVVLCCQDWALKHILGNLNSQTLDEIYRGKEFKRIINGQIAEDSDILCRTCCFGLNLVCKTITEGDTLYNLSGIFWSYMYNSNYNVYFRKRNPDPNKIKTGDVFICAQ